MTHTILVNDKQFMVYDWFEAPATAQSESPPPPHSRDRTLLEEGVSDLRPGEVSFRCDQTLVFDTTFELDGDGRKFVVISSGHGCHVAKPY